MSENTRMDEGNFWENLEDYFGVAPMENYDEIMEAIIRSGASLTPPSLKCPKCGEHLVSTDFENFDEQLDSYREGIDKVPEITVNMACLNEKCPTHGNENFLAVFRLVEVK